MVCVELGCSLSQEGGLTKEAICSTSLQSGTLSLFLLCPIVYVGTAETDPVTAAVEDYG